MQDEELPQPPPRSVRRTRLGWAVAVLVGVAIVVVAIARLSSHTTPRAAPPTVTVPPSTASPATSPTASPAPSSTRPPSADKPPAVLQPLTRLSRAAIDDAHAECPRLAPTCTTTGETPAAVGAALRAAFPKATHLVAVSDIAYRIGTGPRLTYRRLSARAGRMTIAVEVRQSSAGDGVGSLVADEGPQHVVRAETVVGSLTVEVQLTAPADRYLDASKARRLVADHRLLATG